MKILCSVLIICALMTLQRVYGQTPILKEWLSQKKTQKEYLIKQIAALEAYINLGKNGYKIYKTGLNTIGNLKNGEFILHDDFFNSLKNINPSISKYPRVKDIVENVNNILTIQRAGKDNIRNNALIRPEEKKQLLETIALMQNESESLLQELNLVLEPGALEMKDDERIQRIDKIHQDVLLLLHQVSQLNHGTIMLQKGRKTNALDIQNMRKLVTP
ncbi:hypothetical protein D3C73_462220 [compost metagenome]